MDVFGTFFILILPAVAHILTIVIFIMLLGTSKRLEMLKIEVATLKQLASEKVN